MNENTNTNTNTNTEANLTLVLGASGKTGRRVADRLEAAGVNVRRGSRTASPPFDWEDPATWPAVLDGVTAVYVSFFPDIAVPGAPEAIAASRSSTPTTSRTSRSPRSPRTGTGTTAGSTRSPAPGC
jgi:hypothetical protein